MPNIERCLHLAVDHEAGVEDLVAAMLAVGLREHHQLDIGRVAIQARLESVDQVVDFVVGQREAEPAVRDDQRAAALAQQVDVHQRLGGLLVEQVDGRLALERDALGHAVVQQHGRGPQLVVGQRLDAAQQARPDRQPELGHALDAVQRQAAVARDVGGLAGPRRDRAQARHHHHQRGVGGVARRAGVVVAVAQQAAQLADRVGLRLGIRPDPMDMARGDPRDARRDGLQLRQQRLGAEGGQGVAALEVQQVLLRGGHAVWARGRERIGFGAASWAVAGSLRG